jgi:hypothetical protein
MLMKCNTQSRKKSVEIMNASHAEGGTKTEGVREQGAEVDIWA